MVENKVAPFILHGVECLYSPRVQHSLSRNEEIEQKDKIKGEQIQYTPTNV